MSGAMLEEWNRHRSAFARRWLVQMMGRKKLELEIVSEDVNLRGRIGLTIATESARRAMLKDTLLIEAAMRADRIALSRDEVSRALFKESAKKVIELRAIVWANPEREEDSVIPWLEAGAPLDRHRQLGG